MLGLGRGEAEHSRDSTAEEMDFGSRRHEEIETTPGTLKVTISRSLGSTGHMEGVKSGHLPHFLRHSCQGSPQLTTMRNSKLGKEIPSNLQIQQALDCPSHSSSLTLLLHPLASSSQLSHLPQHTPLSLSHRSWMETITMTLQVLVPVSGIPSRPVLTLVCLGFLERISPALDLASLNQI